MRNYTGLRGMSTNSSDFTAEHLTPLRNSELSAYHQLHQRNRGVRFFRRVQKIASMKKHRRCCRTGRRVRQLLLPYLLRDRGRRKRGQSPSGAWRYSGRCGAEAGRGRGSGASFADGRYRRASRHEVIEYIHVVGIT